MAEMQTREKRLLGLLLFALLFVATWFLWSYFSENLDKLRKGITQEEITKKTHIMRKNQIGDWLPRRNWLDTNQPRIQDGIDPMGNLENFAINSALSEGLALTRPADPRGENVEATHISYSLDLIVKGEWGSIVRWLASLQDRDRFVVLTRCEIMPVKRDSEEIRCNTRIERWYALEEGMVAVAPPVPAPGAEGEYPEESDVVPGLPPGVGPEAGKPEGEGNQERPPAREVPPGTGDAAALPGQPGPGPGTPAPAPVKPKVVLPPSVGGGAPQPQPGTASDTEAATSEADSERSTSRRRRIPGRRTPNATQDQ